MHRLDYNFYLNTNVVKMYTTTRVGTISLFLSDTFGTALRLTGGMKISEKTLVGRQVPKTRFPTSKNVKLAIFSPKISNIQE